MQLTSSPIASSLWVDATEVAESSAQKITVLVGSQHKGEILGKSSREKLDSQRRQSIHFFFWKKKTAAICRTMKGKNTWLFLLSHD